MVGVELPVIIISYPRLHLLRCSLAHWPWSSSNKFTAAWPMLPSLPLLLLLFCFSRVSRNSFTALCHAELREIAGPFKNPSTWLQESFFPPHQITGNWCCPSPLLPIQPFVPLSTTSKSSMHPVPTNRSAGSVVTSLQGLTWIRTGHNFSFSGIIHTKASKYARTITWCFMLHEILSPSGWAAGSWSHSIVTHLFTVCARRVSSFLT